MDPIRWKYFRIAFVVAVGTGGLLMYEQGGFDQVSTKGAVAILILAIAAVGFVIYRFIRDHDDPDHPFG